MESKINKKFNYDGLRNSLPIENNIVYFRNEDNEISLSISNECPFCIRNRDLSWRVSNLYLEKDPIKSVILKEAISRIKKILDSKKDIKKVKICGYRASILRLDILHNIIAGIWEILPDAEIQLTTTVWPIYTYFKNTGESLIQKAYKNG